jgi:uncharacterized membrane protein
MTDGSDSQSKATATEAFEPKPSKGRFRRFFFRGLGVLLPTALTLWLLSVAFQFVNAKIAAPINAGARWTLVALSAEGWPLESTFRADPARIAEAVAAAALPGRTPPAPERIDRELRTREVDRWWSDRWYVWPFGFVVSLVLVWLVGRLVGGYVGTLAFRGLERVLHSVPIVRNIYPQVKQFVGFFLGDGGDGDGKKSKPSRVVLVPWPRPGMWAIGLVTGPALPAAERVPGDSLTVFVPASPPISGFTMTVPKSEAIELPMTIDEALRYLVSGGVLVPPTGSDPTLPHRLP